MPGGDGRDRHDDVGRWLATELLDAIRQLDGAWHRDSLVQVVCAAVACAPRPSGGSLVAGPTTKSHLSGVGPKPVKLAAAYARVALRSPKVSTVG